MKKTLLSTAGALALTITLGAGAAFAANNDGNAVGDDQVAVQDVLNGSLNGNDVQSHNDSSTNSDSSTNVDDSLNGNDLLSHNDLDLDNQSHNDLSTNTWISDISLQVSTQTLAAVASGSAGSFLMDDIETGGVDFDFDGAAGSMTSSVTTGIGSNAQAASAILANGGVRID